MSHYFTGNNTEHEYKEIEFRYNDKVYRFRTDRGVFSKDRVDYGSHVLIDAVAKDRSTAEDDAFIDMGAGYGPVGTVLADVLRASPLMVEVNSDALALCEENARRNGVAAKVMDREEFDACPAGAVSFYVTNPPFRAGKPTVIGMIEDAHDRLGAGGAFYMVVQKKQGMASYRKEIESQFGNVEVIAKDKGYHVLKGIKA
ncbi:class I SAM-dependent methyltransferase [Salinicoccus cyprini]|uniref:Class I SAM-dependent methyltransferase n=1 Tax=Salinicoccus cyprini TaxID=2493691 RepID=A0A558ARW1_9STAP|nr:methyltransferase [Salinicoccus cyprini]TVT27005.1 class I SAM-dependent methyltransferase [Salinicoccus cyprini]